MRASWIAIPLLCLASPVHSLETLAHGRFAQVRIFRPQSDAQQIVLLLSDADGWSAVETSVALALARDGALVAGIDLAQFELELERDGASCVYPDGDLENLSHFIQAYYGLPGYRVPLLAGAGEGAAFAYAVLAQSGEGIFGGALSMDFCPRMRLEKPLCASGALHAAKSTDDHGSELSPGSAVPAPWIVMRAADDPACALDTVRRFVARTPATQLIIRSGAGDDLATEQGVTLVRAAYERLSQTPVSSLPVVPGDLSDLPLVEVPPHGRVNAMAIFVSGDGGWAGLDKSVATAIAAEGIPVVGLDSLRYFWTPRTPESVAADVERILRYYLAHWSKSQAILIGYSQGANVLPFVVNRLPEATRGKIALVALMGLGQTANFEFHLSNWVAKDRAGTPILPEFAQPPRVPVVCLYGEDEGGSLCPQLSANAVQIVKVQGGHHFGGDYEQLAKLLLGYARVP